MSLLIFSFSTTENKLLILCPSFHLERNSLRAGNTQSRIALPLKNGAIDKVYFCYHLTSPLLMSWFPVVIPQALSCVRFPRASLLSVNNSFQCCYSSRSFCILIGPPGIKMPPEPKEWISNGGILGICDRHCGRFYGEGSLWRQTPWQLSIPLTWCSWPYKGVRECELISNWNTEFYWKENFKLC